MNNFRVAQWAGPERVPASAAACRAAAAERLVESLAPFLIVANERTFFSYAWFYGLQDGCEYSRAFAPICLRACVPVCLGAFLPSCLPHNTSIATLIFSELSLLWIGHRYPMPGGCRMRHAV